MSRSLSSVSTVKPHVWIMSALFAGAMIIGVLLLPGESERIAMLERDGNNLAALQILEARFKAGDRHQRTLFQLQRFYEHFGHLDKSRRTLEMLARERPDDAYVQRQLAHLYKATQDHGAYMGALRRQLSIRYSLPACRELIGLLRRNGNYEREQRRIEQCLAEGYRRADDLIRLAFLNAVDGDLGTAADLLMSVDDRGRLTKDHHRIMLFEALLASNRPDEARRRGVRWLRRARDDGLALTLISRLTREKRYQLAIQLARDASRPGDSVSLTVAELMLTQDQSVAARSYLRGWLEQTTFATPGMSGRFVQSALDADDVELALAVRGKSKFADLAQRELSALGIAVAAAGKTAEFKKILGLLQPQTIKAYPLLAAAAAQFHKQNKRSARILASIQTKSLDEWERALVLRLRKRLKK